MGDVHASQPKPPIMGSAVAGLNHTIEEMKTFVRQHSPEQVVTRKATEMIHHFRRILNNQHILSDEHPELFKWIETYAKRQAKSIQGKLKNAKVTYLLIVALTVAIMFFAQGLVDLVAIKNSNIVGLLFTTAAIGLSFDHSRSVYNFIWMMDLICSGILFYALITFMIIGFTLGSHDSVNSSWLGNVTSSNSDIGFLFLMSLTCLLTLIVLVINHADVVVLLEEYVGTAPYYDAINGNIINPALLRASVEGETIHPADEKHIKKGDKNN